MRQASAFIAEGCLAFEAYMEQQFGQAISYIGQYLAKVPEDPAGWINLGDYHACAGSLARAIDAYAKSVEHGAEPVLAAEHAVRSIVYLTPEVDCGRSFTAADLADKCQSLGADFAPEQLTAGARTCADEWNRLRDGAALRCGRYRTNLQFAATDAPWDFAFVLLPLLMFEGGYPPHGVKLLTQLLNDREYVCRILDLNLEIWEALNPDQRTYWRQDCIASWREPYRYRTGVGIGLRNDLRILAEICSEAPAPALGFSCFQVNRGCILDFVPRIRGKQILLGGPDCFLPHQCALRYCEIADHVSAFVLGEGEQTLLALAERIRSGRSFAHMTTIVMPGREGPGAVELPPTVPVTLLSHYSHDDPAYIARLPKETPHLLATNRGCVNRCDFCYDSAVWHRFRLRPLESILEEMQYSIETHQRRLFYFADSATNASIKHLDQLCDLILERIGEDSVEISTSIMITSEMSAELYAKMYRAGFRKLYFGVESASSTVLRAMGKRGDASEVERNLRLSHEAGLHNHIFLMVGHPSEGEDEFQETLEFVRNNAEYIAGVDMINPCYLLRGTRLAEQMRQRGVEMPPNWDVLATWTDGNNHLGERLRRKQLLADLVRELQIGVGWSVGAADTPACEKQCEHDTDPPPDCRPAAAAEEPGLRGRLANIGRRLGRIVRPKS